MEIYKSNYTLILLDSENSLMVVRRTLPDYVDDDEYKESVRHWIETYLKYPTEAMVVDLRENKHAASPELQQWLNENLMAPAFKAGLRRVAMLVSKDFFAQLSFEQAMNEDEGKKFVTRYFEDEDDARKWLLNP